MSVSTDLNTLRERVKVLEVELDRATIGFDFSLEEIREYKVKYDKLQARYNTLKGECAELKVDNRRLTRMVNEPNAQFASPPIAPQSGEVASLRQRLAEKDQFIAALEEKYQSLLNSKTSATQGAIKNPSSHADPKTSVTEVSTKTLSERPASRSKSPSLEGPGTYSGVTTSRGAQVARRGRTGQPTAPVSHEDLARQEALRAKKKEEIRKSEGRSLKPNKVVGFQPSQKQPESAEITAPSLTRQSVTGEKVTGKSHGAGFKLREDRPSSPVPKEKVLSASPRSLQGTQGSASKGQTPTGPATRTDLGKITTPAPSTYDQSYG